MAKEHNYAFIDGQNLYLGVTSLNWHFDYKRFRIYLKEKYGADHVAQIITFGTMAARAALRDAGRAMGFGYGFCDQIAKLIPFNPTQGMKEGWLSSLDKMAKAL